MRAWQDIKTAPRDATVLVTVKPSEHNKAFATWPIQTHAAYIDEDGNICNAETLVPDGSLHGQYWITTDWMPMPSPKTPEQL